MIKVYAFHSSYNRKETSIPSLIREYKDFAVMTPKIPTSVNASRTAWSMLVDISLSVEPANCRSKHCNSYYSEGPLSTITETDSLSCCCILINHSLFTTIQNEWSERLWRHEKGMISHCSCLMHRFILKEKNAKMPRRLWLILCYGLIIINNWRCIIKTYADTFVARV